MSVYIAQHAPNLQFRLEDVQFKFENGRMEVEDGSAEEEMLEEFLKTKKGAAINGMIRKVDYEAAAEQVKKYVEINQGRAVVGSMTTQHMDEMRRIKIQASAQMAHLTSREEIAKFQDDLAHGDMLLQDQVQLPDKGQPASDAQPSSESEGQTPAFVLPQE